MAFEVRTTPVKLADGADTPALALGDGQGQSLLLAPALGFNVLSWREPARGKAVELLWRDEATLTHSNGIKQGLPILFPFANRLRDGRFRWRDRTWELVRNCPRGQHAIHGAVWNQPWHVITEQADAGEASVCAEITLPESSWPGRLRLRTTTRLKARQLIQDYFVRNEGDEEAPFSLGLHPYWRLPPDTSEVFVDRGEEQATVWELRDCLPTGGRLPARGKHAKLLKKTKKPLGADRFDDALRIAGANPPVWTLRSAEGWRLELEASGGFRDFVLFTPPHREAICLEPYTAVTDAINLHARAIDSGLRTLAPGKEWRGRLSVRFVDEAAV